MQDNWGKNALRNMLAEGPMHAPFTTWTLSAPSAAELHSWLDGFAAVCREVASPAADTAGAHGYEPIGDTGATRTVARTPVIMGSEEVA